MPAQQTQNVIAPFLRLYQPDATTPEPDAYLSLQAAFDLYRWPDLQARKSSGDGKRWMRLWKEFEDELCQAQRIESPLRVTDIGSTELRAFRIWLQDPSRYPPPKGNSSANKAIKEVVKVLALAAEDGVEVKRSKPPRQLPEAARPRYYLDNESINRLWHRAATCDWPPKHISVPKRGHAFRGSGVPPAVFWRCVFVLLRNYGMRVQDLVAYAKDKSPVTWADISLDPQSPNPESLEQWPLGWLHYTASKTGREYYLPLTPSARGAIDRLRAGAFALYGGRIPRDASLISNPKSHGLTDRWRELQTAADVATRGGEPYQLEDFRKTVATYAGTVDSELPNAICGWGPGGSGIKNKHYQQPEPLLVRKILHCPLPDCFDAWSDPEHVELTQRFVESLSR